MHWNLIMFLRNSVRDNAAELEEPLNQMDLNLYVETKNH